MRSSLLAWLLAAGYCCCALATSDVNPYFKATNYDFTLIFSLSPDPPTFQGIADITLQSDDTVPLRQKDFVLNAAGLSPSQVTVFYPNGRRWNVPASAISTDPVKETITFLGREYISKNSSYRLRIAYTGKYNSTGGILGTAGDNGYYITSRLYPSFSRRVFPCLDRPGALTNLTLNIQVSYEGKEQPQVVTGLTAKSNAKLVRNGVVTFSYASPISIPLNGIFFAIGQYRQVAQTGFWTWTTNDDQRTQTIINALQTPTVKDMYDAVKLKPTVVLVPGLPADCESGFAVTAISQSSITDQGSYASLRNQDLRVVTGLMKSLFRYVVSPSNWSDIWMGESVPLFIAEAVLPEIARWQDWVQAGAVNTALDGTWSDSSMPVCPEFSNSSEVISFINSPSVAKGAAILGMIESLLPSEYRLSTYKAILSNMAGQSISTEEFLMEYSALNKLNETDILPEGKTLAEIVLPWLTQTGYPSVILNRRATEVDATEEKFGPSTKVDATWTIPILYMRSNDSKSELKWYLPAPNSKVALVDDADENTAVIVNSEGSGLYRTLYDENDIQILERILLSNVDNILPATRASIIRDSLAFVKSRRGSYYFLLNLLGYLENERGLEPWQAVDEVFQELWTYLWFADSDLRIQFENFSTNLLRYSYKEMKDFTSNRGMKNSSVQAIVTRLHCDFHDDDCRSDTLQFFNSKQKTNNIDLDPVIKCNGLRPVNDFNVLQAMFTNYNVNQNDEIKRQVFSYLACPRDNKTMTSYLQALLVGRSVGTDMPADDMLAGYQAVASRPEHLDLAFTFLIDNFKRIHRVFTDQHKAKIIRFLGKKGSASSHQEFLNEIRELSNATVILEATDAALASVEERINFLSDNYDSIAAGLYGDQMPTTPTTERPTSGNPTDAPTDQPTVPTTVKPNAGSMPAQATWALALLFLAGRLLK